MNKFKLFIENFVIYGFGGVIAKIIPLIMVPIITYIIPETAYYGVSDLSHTLSNVGCSLATMGMYDAMYRMFFEKDEIEFKKSICSTTLLFTFSTSIIVSLLMITTKEWLAEVFFGGSEYEYLVYITAMATLVGATNNIISAPTRMQNKRKIYLIANTVGPVIAYSISIPLLLKGYYVIALPVSTVVSSLSLEITYGILNKQWFELKKVEFKHLKPLLTIAIPLLPNFLIYWLFNSSDKIMITNMVGVGAAGIYAVAAKIGQISQIVYTAFAGGWQYFAFSTMKEDDQVETNSRIFEYLGAISFVISIFVCACSSMLFKIFFKSDYYSGYISAPYLFLAPLLQMLFQVACNQFLVIKKTWPNMLILFSGAVINIILNYFLIPVLGIEGASIATLAGYIISDIIICFVLVHMKLMVISKQFIAAVGVFSLGFITWRLLFSEQILIGLVIAVLVTIIIAWCYKKEIFNLLGIIKTFIKNRSKENGCK